MTNTAPISVTKARLAAMQKGPAFPFNRTTESVKKVTLETKERISKLIPQKVYRNLQEIEKDILKELKKAK